jgi:RNA recognition motif-containing protein
MGKKLFVGNLSFQTTDQTLAETFAECGTVQSGKVITDRDTGRSKGFGFVEMSTDAEAAAAIARFNGSEAENGGRALTVSEAKPKAPRDDRGGGGGGGGNRW